MEEASNPNPNPTNPPMSQQQFQQQLFLLHQYQQQQHHHHQQQQQHHNQQQLHPPPQQQPTAAVSLHQQQQQAAMSRFPSNIDAHLRAPGLRSNVQHKPTTAAGAGNASSSSPALAAAAHSQFQQHQQQAKAAVAGGGGGIRGSPVEAEMVQQDLTKICKPDFKRPFASVEDAVFRLLPYHVVSDYEAEEDDRMLDSDTTGQIPSRLQQWDHNILAKIAEFTTTFEKQVLAFNIMSRKRALGEFRSEERLMIEQALLNEEKQAIYEMRAEIESREKATREAAEAQAKVRMAMAQAEQARAEAQAHAEMMARAPMRASAVGSHGDEGSGGHDLVPGLGGNMEEMIHGWGHNNNNNGQRDEEEPSEDFLNDDNEQEEDDEEAEMQEEWRDSGELDLNTR
ncbi:uncharacterized protein M6B38_381095 [Iris pallida]|uniref:GLTSCR protein conserved domain-containing protein n=1 Tax=Iris pallida TaxID=29817 RepID=A0AAX6G996_IRIPA|nr:uncharacterized protein M6B38_381095 [Iris pallida]